jgi:hypothetical protein
LDIVNAKNTSHIERKTRLSSPDPKGYFVLGNEQLDSSCSSSIVRVGDEKHLYVVPATNLRCLHLRAKFSHGGAGLGGVVRTKGL